MGRKGERYIEREEYEWGKRERERSVSGEK